MSTTKPFRCIVLGEVLWDLLPAAKQPGGAPANFAAHAHAPGAEALEVPRAGNDPLGCEILDRLRRLGLRTDGTTQIPNPKSGIINLTFPTRNPPDDSHN